MTRYPALFATALVLLLTGLLARPADGQSPSDPEVSLPGLWMGTTDLNGEFRYRLFFHVEWDGEALTGTLDAPARRITDLPLAVSANGDSLAMKVTSRFSAHYRGRLADGDEKIEGTWNGEDLELTKTAGPAEILADPFAEPFRGITTGGEPRRELFPIRSTGVSTEPIAEAAEALLRRLSREQRARATFPVESGEWRHWTNSPFLERRGVLVRDMTEAQRAAAFDLLRAGLSARGFSQARDIMRVEGYLSRLIENRERFGEQLYHLTVMGEPSMSEPWGWQLDGHHLVVNFFVLGDQVVMTPSFFGSEPVVVDSGRHAGTKVLQAEQDRGLAFLRSLHPDQREAAILDQETEGSVRAGAFQDNLTLEYEGLRADRLSDSQRTAFLDLIELYVGRLRERHAEVRMQEVRRHLDETRFAWIGDTDSDGVYYYRIHSPVLLIEFDHALRRTIPGEPGPTRDHIHTIVRTPNGGDYGRALLKRHYEAHKDNPDHEHHR